MMNKFKLVMISLFLFNIICSDETTTKAILYNKDAISSDIKSIDDKNVVLESGSILKNDEVQEIFFRNKGENGPPSVLLLNNDAMLLFSDFTFLNNKVTFTLLNETMELPVALIKGIVYKNFSSEDVKVWKKSLLVEVRKSDVVFVLKDEKLIPIEGLIKEIEKDKIKLIWGGEEKSISMDKVVSVLFASTTDKLVSNYEVQTIDGSKIYCFSVLFNNDSNCKIGFSNKEEDIHLSNDKICRIIFNNRKATYLSLLTPIDVITDKILIEINSYWEKDQSVWKKPLSVGSKVYSRGLGVHSYCRLKYTIPEGCIQFVSDYGIDNEVLNNSGCIFKILVDKKVFLDVVVKSADGAKSITIDLPSQSQEIILIVEPGPNLDIGDHGVWGNARFIKN